jgi:hypothetical protein
MALNKEMILGLIRHILTFGGGWLTTKGALSAQNTELLIGAAITLIGVAWSFWDKKEPTA